MLHDLSLTVLLPWQHTGFQTSPVLKKFLATFGAPFSYLQMVPHIHDPTSIFMYVSLSLWPHLMFFELKITNTLKSSGWGLLECIVMATKLSIAVGVFSIELLAYQVSMVYTENWPR